MPSEPGAANAPIVLPLTEMGKATGQWTLTLHPFHLALADAPGAQPYVFPRELLMKSVILMEGTRAFVVEQPRKTMFKLTPAGVTALADWIGKPFLAAFYLKRRFSWILPWAILWVAGSLLSVVPTASGGASPHFDATGFTLGLILVGAWAFAKWRPHPVLFLVDSVWFSWVAVNLTFMVVQGRSKGWLVLVVLLSWMAVTGLKHFFRFRRTKIEFEIK
ncbi:MAG TPA: hypothetical protein VJW76_12895 [Verrucomicrobiae bacterium]|nr:hypothetical protein [Verrucomicrobiae bacterium]